MFRQVRYRGITRVFNSSYKKQDFKEDLIKMDEEAEVMIEVCLKKIECEKIEKKIVLQDLRRALKKRKKSVNFVTLVGSVREDVVKIEDILDLEIDEGFVEEEVLVEEEWVELKIIERVNKAVESENKKIDLKTNEVFVTGFIEIEDLIDIEDEAFEMTSLENLKKKELRKSEIFEKTFRNVLDFSNFEPVNAVPILDIRFPVKENTKIDKKLQKTQSPLSSPISISNYKIVEINTLSDIKNLNLSKKSVTLDLSPKFSTFTTEEHLTQVQKTPIKIFYDQTSKFSKALLESIISEHYNAIGIETPSLMMNCVDLILTWQSAVKFISFLDINKHETVKDYLQTINSGLMTFENVLLVVVQQDSWPDPQTLETLHMYSEYLLNFDVKGKVFVADRMELVSICVTEYLEKYLRQVKDLGIWNWIQESISELVPGTVNEELNLYAMHIVWACIKWGIKRFNETCNCLGSGSYGKYEKILQIFETHIRKLGH